MPILLKVTNTTSTADHLLVIPDATDDGLGVVTLNQVKALAGGGGQASEVVFVFRPGSVPSGNVYNDWTALMAAVDAKQGLRYLEFDDSLAPVVVPTGTWNMDQVIWTGTFNKLNPGVVVTVVEGAVFLQLRQIQGGLTVVFTGATAPVSDFGGSSGLTFRESCSIQCTGTGPFIQNSVPGAIASVSFQQFARFAAGAVPVMDIAAGSAGVLAGFSIGTIDPNTISGPVGSTFIFVTAASSAFLDQTQPAFLGTRQYANLAGLRLNPSDNTVTTTPYNASRNELVRVNLTSTTINVILPPAYNTRGMFVLVKNINTAAPTLGATITVTGQGGDTVDGGASLVISAARGFLMFTSDGVSDWILDSSSSSGGSTVVTQVLPVASGDGFSKAFLWTVPMAAAYTVTLGVLTTAGTAGTVVGIDIATFGLAGFTLLFSAPFDGEVHVQGVLL